MLNLLTSGQLGKTFCGQILNLLLHQGRITQKGIQDAHFTKAHNGDDGQAAGFATLLSKAIVGILVLYIWQTALIKGLPVFPRASVFSRKSRGVLPLLSLKWLQTCRWSSYRFHCNWYFTLTSYKISIGEKAFWTLLEAVSHCREILFSDKGYKIKPSRKSIKHLPCLCSTATYSHCFSFSVWTLELHDQQSSCPLTPAHLRRFHRTQVHSSKFTLGWPRGGLSTPASFSYPLSEMLLAAADTKPVTKEDLPLLDALHVQHPILIIEIV